MNTPIFDFINEYVRKDPVRLHMPGHKGKNVFEHDITEIEGADCLSAPLGIIYESEANAGFLFGSHTLFSTEGSSLCIRAMLFLIKKRAMQEGRNAFILAARNAHASFVTAAAVLDIDTEWIMQKKSDSYESVSITGGDIAEYVQTAGTNRLPDALYITSPDYLGKMADIKDISEVCHKHGILLIVDCAHGAYLKFLKKSMYPTDLGADMCCSSAHKTLPVLTGGAYLHISKNLDEFFYKNAKQAMSVFATTSPSYLLMESLDKCNAFLENNKSISETAERVGKLKKRLKTLGLVLVGDEPLKITVSFADNTTDFKDHFPDGEDLTHFLITKGIYTEYHDKEHVVMMFGSGNSETDYVKILAAFEDYVKKYPIISQRKPDKNSDEVSENINLQSGKTMRKQAPQKAMSFKEAMFADSEEVDVHESIGRVLAQTLVHCPPCVPMYMLGEVIGEDIEKYCSGKVSVVKIQ